jgi:Pyruvate/2-oxoacid:ferredoxin oxidoreductase delta subunit
MIIERLREEISAKPSHGWRACIHFLRYREESRLSRTITRELSIKYIYGIGELRGDHACCGRCGDTEARWEEPGHLNFERSKIWVWEDDDLRPEALSPFKSGLNDLGRSKWSLRFCESISMCQEAIDSWISYFDLGWFYLYSRILLSLLLDDRARPRRSFFTLVISAYRNSLNLPSTLTVLLLKNSYRSSPQLRFLLVNFNSSKPIIRLSWLMIQCLINCQLCQIFVNRNVFWKNVRGGVMERVAYRRCAPIDIGLEECSDRSGVRWTENSEKWNNRLSNW